MSQPADAAPEDIRHDRRRLLGAGLASVGAALAAPLIAQAQVPALRGAPAINKRLPDVVVIGAGAFGGWTALRLRELGVRVTLVDAYGAGNARGSSGDESRLIRAAYGDREVYSRWAQAAVAAWSQRQEEFGRRLLFLNGSLRAGADRNLSAQRQVFERLGLPYEMLDGADVSRRWPQLRYEAGEPVFFEPQSGVVKARESMIAVSEAFMHKAGQVRIGQALPGQAAAGKLQTITLDGTPLAAGQFVFACGPWLPKVLPQVMGDKIRVPRREMFYVGSPMGDARYRWEHVPNLTDSEAYTAADVDYGYKVAPRLADVAMDPDSGERLPSSFLVQQLKAYVARRLPGLVGQPVVATRVCQTEYSDNSDFIIDRHPEFTNAWIAGGGSGHAFKMGPVLGDYVAGRVLDTEHDPRLKALFALAAHGPVKPI